MSTQDVSSDVKLTIVEHLEELRDRLIVIAVALLVGTAFSLFFTDSLLEVLIQPMKDVGIKPLAIHPVEPFVVYFKVALIAGVAIAMPVILYEVVRYLLPALTPKEKQYLYLLLPFGTIFFTGGLVFASFIMLPTAVHFLAGFLRNLVDRGWTMDNYVSFVTTIMFWMGIIFELPLVPVERPGWPPGNRPEFARVEGDAVPVIRSFADLLEAARRSRPLPIAVAGADDLSVLQSAAACVSLGLAEPILVGPKARIRGLAADASVDLRGCRIVHGEGGAMVASTMDLVRSGQARVAVKGQVSTTAFLHAALERSSGLRTERLVSHVGIFEVPGFPQLLCITDGGVVLYPDARQKVEIIRNSIAVARALGIEQPRVALLAGSDEVTLERPVTRDIAGLVALAGDWEALGAWVDGPLALDTAVDPAIAAAVGRRGEVAGRAQVLVGPTLEATNTMCKAITYFAGGHMAGLVVGTRAPLALGSRSDPPETRLACIAAGVLYAGCSA